MPLFSDILSAIDKKENILLMGPGGTGKSVLLKLIYAIHKEVKQEICVVCNKLTSEIVPCQDFHKVHKQCVFNSDSFNKLGILSCPVCHEVINKKWNETEKPETIFLTATTGIAAFNIGGCTIHHWSGIQTGRDTIDHYLARNRRTTVGKNIKNCQLLIIDEISMLGKTLFDKLDILFKKFRNSSNPFGGIQVIFSGDFLQLPPVKDEWIFKSENWDKFNFKTFVLRQSMRYQASSFYSLLLRIRDGTPTEEDNNLLKTRLVAYQELKKNQKKLDIKPTIIHSKKVDVEGYNLKELERCPGPEYCFEADDVIEYKDKTRLDRKTLAIYQGLLDNTIADEIVLRVGAQVMLKANLNVSIGLVNGSRGVVVQISEYPTVIMVKFMDRNIYQIREYTWDCSDKEKNIRATRKQIPLILAWSLTIHKTQSCTLDSIVCDLGPSIFESGQAYVALSRARKIEGLYLSNFVERSIKANRQALLFQKEQEETSENQEDDGLKPDEKLQEYIEKYKIL
jgi:ATP-dependent DNA helicase PIF1